ncbi:MAG TPA: carboxypeptidase-like regulatory domain-containing protein [Longimicrobiaceae bacterium]|nr:carboxypeptidase-like regulatory domain-containing protein [Longimicrobiaceae bacterium]
MPHARLRTLVLLAAALLLPLAVRAQSVEGTLVEEGTGRPVQGALVTLLGAGGEALARDLTDAAGRFTLRAPAAGEYRVRADRIGFGSTTSAPLRLGVDEAVPLRLTASGALVRIAGIRAEARATRRCATRTQAGPEVATLWEEARKALALAEYTRRERGYAFALRTFRRVLDPASGLVLAESGDSARTESVEPFVALPAEELDERGYVRPDSSGISYFGPDAGVLLSDVFLAGHCFRVEEPEEPGSGLVGLAFEPVRDRRLPDVRGVLWLDRATNELHSLRYGYTNLPFARPDEWGGWVRFHRLENGAWIVRRWTIRMPVFHEDPEIAGDDRATVEATCPGCDLQSRGRRVLGGPGRMDLLAQVVEQGGEVERGTVPGGATVTLAERSSLHGVVFDSTAGRPLAGARVFLTGTRYAAVTDSAGRFALEGVPEALYAVAFTHPRADTLEFDPTPQPVRVRTGVENRVELAIAGLAPARVAALERAARGGQVRRAQADPGAAVALSAVEASARREVRLLANQGFYRRQRTERGVFLTEEQIRAKLPIRPVDLVRGIHGIRPRPAGRGEIVLTQRRLDRFCLVPLYVDGVLVPQNTLERLRADEIAAVEVYQGEWVPPQFNPYRDGRGCGAVVIWTTTAAR